MPKRVGVNGKGYRVGESHQCAKLSDEEVELAILLLTPDEFGPGLSLQQVADKLGVTKSTVHRLRKGINRGQRPERWRAAKTGAKA